MISAVLLPTILVTGGAGYIGSNTALYLAQKGYNIIALDTLRHQQILPDTFRIKPTCSGKNLFDPAPGQTQGQIVVIKSDFANKKVLTDIFQNNNVQAVMHFAALIEVGESVKNPREFYNNNVIKTIALLETMLDHNIKKFIFSSSCAVYGEPQELPLTETHPKNPISPYGKNKLMVEMALEDFAQAYGLQFVSLRYFNAAGGMPDYGLGEQHTPETHLIPILFRAAHENRPFYIFGNDYPTKDGSCIRDFLHIWDLAQAHWLALEHLNNGQPSDFFNLGTGNGFSVKEMVKMVEKVCNMQINCIVTKRRAGDPPVLVANPSKAYTILNWKPQCSKLDYIIKTANAFYTKIHDLNKSKRQPKETIQ